MLNRIQLIKGVGQFDSASLSANEQFNRLTLIYGENGRGKTTLSSVLSSLMSGNTSLIEERKRLGFTDSPHVVIAQAGSGTLQFKENQWSGSAPPMAVFDDGFIDANICSGLAVATSHRQKLHELILGAKGVALNATLQDAVKRVEEHNSALKELAAAIPASVRGDVTVDKFCALEVPDDIDQQLQDAERNLAALKQSDAIQNTPAFVDLSLPEIDPNGLSILLGKSIDDLSDASLAAVQSHAGKIGSGGEAWLAGGMARVIETDEQVDCPFCGQDLSDSDLYEHLRGYFGDAYKGLKDEIAKEEKAFSHTHSEDAPAAFERSVRVAIERRSFWSQFCDIPEVSIDTAAVARCWKDVREQVAGLLKSKQQSPLEQIAVPVGLTEKIEAYQVHRAAIAALSTQLGSCREAIDAVKEKAGAGNAASVEADLARLKAVKQRSMDAVSKACDAYLAEKQLKKATEDERDKAKEQLKSHRETIFPKYETAINGYLQKFNANFRLSSVKAADTRGGPTCNYGVLVNSSSDPIDISTPPGQGPSFKTALSSGDRNTLALAFFLSSIDDHPQIASLVVIIDDPINSLDDHRTVATAVEVRKLLQRVTQVVVLSHSKPFLCRLWEGTEESEKTAYEIRRSTNGSILSQWDVTQDCVTEHDKRHELLEAVLGSSPTNPREVARAIRPHLEAFCRVAYPRWFWPGQLLGPFCGLCEQRFGQSDEILSQQDTEELKDIKDYANRYHHDTNASWETESINDGELLGYVRRTLAFIRRA